MIESAEEIALSLSLAGEELEFPYFSIRGIPGEDIQLIQGYDALPYEAKKFSFMVSSIDVEENEIKEEETFFYRAHRQTFTMKVDALSRGLFGWTDLKCSVLEVDNV